MATASRIAHKSKTAKQESISSLPADQLPDRPWLKSFRSQLLKWFGEHARDLPWRRSRDPYRVWVSEIMLQQTQVATVIPYFERFLAAFPTIADLAAAPEQQELRHWEGLGYYRRARQLHRAAQLIASELKGKFPDDPDEVRRLPGIGRYTAGAILSIAFDQPQPIVEANTQRLYSRLLAYGGDLQNKQGQRLLWDFAAAVLPRRGAGTLNQALMELGALICTPRAPACQACPVAALCRARRDGLQEQIPRPRPKPVIEAVRHAAVVVRRGGKILLRQQRPEERWAGLWDFPRFALEQINGEVDAELSAGVLAQTGVRIGPASPLAVLKHGVTRFRITLECFDAAGLSQRGKAISETRWVDVAELDDYPLSTTGRRLADLVAEKPSHNAKRRQRT
jgi:A/G-specific adenine glycosylase